MPIFTSPFPTTHDTIGASTADSPLDLPSSPVSPARPHQDNGDEHEESTINDGANDETNKRSSSSSKEIAITDLEKKLAQYSIDFNKLGGGGSSSKKDERDAQHEEEENPAEPEFGGPEDLTMNLDKYLLGGDLDDLRDKQTNNNNNYDFDDLEDDDLPLDSPSPLPRQNHEIEESEFGPPVDMSTPSHLMWHKNLGLPSGNKEETHLEDIEESSFPSSPEKSASPTKHGDDNDKDEELGRSRTFTTVLREIEDLHEQRRERDERIRMSQEKLASATEEIEYLRAELQRKSSQLADANSKVGEEAVLREQIQALKKRSEERSSKNDEELSSQLTLLREQLGDAQEQVKIKDDALEHSEKRIRELTATREEQLREKDTEIEDLKAQISERDLEIANMGEELAEAKQDYASMESRIAALETRNAPLEEKNILLENEVNRVKSELVAQRNSVSIIATEFSIETDGKTYNDIINSLNKLLKAKQQPASQEGLAAEAADLRIKLSNAEAEAKQNAVAKQAAETEWKRSQEMLAESRSLITTVEGENTRLTTRLHELNSSLSAVREELRLLKEQQREIQPTVSPSRNSVLEAHRLEIQTLKEAHSSAINNLRTSYNDSTTTLRTLLSASEKRETELHAQLHALRTSTNTSSTSITEKETEISALKSQIKHLESTLAVKEETAAEVDRRISRAIERREREWERRIEVLLKEREKMSKALMWAWGEKEVGKTTTTADHKSKEAGGAGLAETQSNERSGGKKQGQGYRYKYVVRS